MFVGRRERLHPAWTKRLTLLMRSGMTAEQAQVRVAAEIERFRQVEFARSGEMPDMLRRFPEDLQV